MNTNKYLEKIAATFAEIPKTEFDMAFEGGPNPTRERILEAAAARDRAEYIRRMNEWRDDARYVSDESPDIMWAHMRDLPALHDVEGETLNDLEREHMRIAAKSGREIKGPSALGLGLGYGAGIGAMGLGALKANPVLLAAGGLTTGITALVHHMRDPKLQERRHLADIDNLVARKHELLGSSQKLGDDFNY